MTSRRVRTLSAVALVAGLASVPALSIRCSDQPDSPDAAVDAAIERRVRDTSSVDNEVVEPDAADAGWVCSPPPGDDGFVHDWPGWRRTTEFDKCCPSDMLEDLTQAVPYDWVSCGTGCLKFNAPTADINGLAPVLAAEVARGKTGQATQISIVRNDLIWGGEKTVYDLATGTPRLSVRFGTNPHCYGSVAAATDDSMLLYHDLYSVPQAPTTGIVVASGTLTSLTQWPSGTVTGLVWGEVNALYNNGRAAFAYLPGTLATCDMHQPGNPKCTMANVASIAPASLNLYPEFFIEGDYVYAPSGPGSAGWAQVYIVEPAGGVKLLRGVSNTHVGAMASDGKNLTWLQVQGDIDQSNPQKPAEVWSAPLTNDPTQLALSAKLIATVPSARAPGAGFSWNGYYAAYIAPDVYIVRVSDGAFVKSPAPPAPYNKYFANVFYITATEIWMASAANVDYQLFRLTLPSWP